MAYDLENRLVIGVVSSAMFDLSASMLFLKETESLFIVNFRKATSRILFQKESPLSFIKRLLSLNDLSPKSDDPLVEAFLYPETILTQAFE